MNEAVREAGLTAVRQVKTGYWDEVRSFLSTLKSPSATHPPCSGSRTGTDGGAAPPTARAEGVSCVVKPVRGCASGGVFRCCGEQEAEVAFGKILGTRKYGTPGAVNDEVEPAARIMLGVGVGVGAVYSNTDLADECTGRRGLF